MSIGGTIWSAFGHTTKATIAAAASLPEVHAVLTSMAIATSPAFKDNDKVITPLDVGVPSTVVIK